MVDDAAVGEVDLAEESTVELSALLFIAGAVNLDWGLPRMAVGGVALAEPGQGVGNLLLADGGVVAFDGLFGDYDVHVWGLAGALLSVAAEEICVLVTMSCDGVLDDHPTAVACLVALPAVQDAFQVVVVDPPSFPGGGARVEDSLDAVEEMRVDERFVPAGELVATVGDEAEVVAVAQHPGQLAD